MASKCKKPAAADLQQLEPMKAIAAALQKANGLRLGRDFINHEKTIKEGLQALQWVGMEVRPVLPLAIKSARFACVFMRACLCGRVYAYVCVLVFTAPSRCTSCTFP